MRLVAWPSKAPPCSDREPRALGCVGARQSRREKSPREEKERGWGPRSPNASLVAAAPATPAGESGSPAPCGRHSSSDRSLGRSVDPAAPTAGQERVEGCSVTPRTLRDCLHHQTRSWGTRTGRKHRSLRGAGTGSAAAVAALSEGVGVCSSSPGRGGSGRCPASQPGRRDSRDWWGRGSPWCSLVAALRLLACDKPKVRSRVRSRLATAAARP